MSVPAVGDSRLHAPVITAAADEAAADAGGAARVHLRSPGVGLWRPLVAVGQAVRAGDRIGELTVLGLVSRLVAGAGARGVAVAVAGGGHAHTPVDHGAILMELDPAAGVTAGLAAAPVAAAAGADGLVVRAPSSGRFYGRPAPGKPPFVTAGDRVKLGQTVCMLEVMKTFHRVTYGGGGLPDEAIVIAVAVADEHDVNPGDVLLRLEAV